MVFKKLFEKSRQNHKCTLASYSGSNISWEHCAHVRAVELKSDHVKESTNFFSTLCTASKMQEPNFLRALLSDFIDLSCPCLNSKDWISKHVHYASTRMDTTAVRADLSTEWQQSGNRVWNVTKKTWIFKPGRGKVKKVW